MPTAVTLEKLQTFIGRDGWKIQSVNINLTTTGADAQHLQPKTTIRLQRKTSNLELQSRDTRVLQYCCSLKPALDCAGEPHLKKVVDNERYYQELETLSLDYQQKLQTSVDRCALGKVHLSFAPEKHVADFLQSRDWGNPRFLPLKVQHFDVVASIMIEARGTFDSLQRFQGKLPKSKHYQERIGELLGLAFGKSDPPVKGYLRYAEATRVDLLDMATKMKGEFAHTDNLFRMLSQRGGLRGSVGLRYLVDMYRRYSEWARPLIGLISEAACIVEGLPLPDPNMGMTKRVELVKQTRYRDVFDCLEPDIRHAASHNAVSYDDDRGWVIFSKLDTNGNINGGFEIGYRDFSNLSNKFARGLIPGMLAAFLLRQQAQLLLTLRSGDYIKLLLLIDNCGDGSTPASVAAT